ncbi:DNA alkylation repair enzyme [Salinispira pacifica]|uniref:DNA alkylation repair enzyme n=1 Tax=Salinispira pacifica TaxID=1307761 RepID=V5WID4_9SPIO|nr:DNA alkylation repair enzyme [Salinispira pacifica]AHC15329.1 DNA alkylation repair enzyme [Salinispira pacifica]
MRPGSDAPARPNSLTRETLNSESIARIAAQIKETWPEFPASRFRLEANRGLESLNFMDRAQQIRDCLIRRLPGNFREAAAILSSSVGPPAMEDAIQGVEGFYILPMSMYISRMGLNDPDAALPALYEMTRRFTAEFDIRPFLIRHEQQTLGFLMHITDDASPFARRLASEGTRPRLPLAPRLRRYIDDPSPLIPILERLHDDPNEMVRRSVANNVNDISKDNPRMALELMQAWTSRASAGGEARDERTDSTEKGSASRPPWVVRHGVRSLVKSANPQALELLGYSGARLRVAGFTLAPEEVELGDALEMNIRIESAAHYDQKLLIQYIHRHPNARGGYGERSFFLKRTNLEAQTVLNVRKLHRFRASVNRRYYPGQHSMIIRVNGRRLGEAPFRFKSASSE